MCAQFHPSEDLIVSASLDQSVRVWDISGNAVLSLLIFVPLVFSVEVLAIHIRQKTFLGNQLCFLCDAVAVCLMDDVDVHYKMCSVVKQ